MRIFVLTTGRTASTTFSKACSHFEGMTASHESKAGKIKGRLDYPDNHVEIDNRLVWFLSSLEKIYKTEDTFYVYLKRDKEEVIKSYIKRWYVKSSIVRGMFNNILMCEGHASYSEKYQSCELYVDTVEDAIESFGARNKNYAVVSLGNIKEDFSNFVTQAGVRCDLEKALSEFDTKTNENQSLAEKFTPSKVINKVKRIFLGIPEYLKVV